MRSRFVNSFVHIVSAKTYADFSHRVCTEAKKLFVSNTNRLIFVRHNRLLLYKDM